MLKKYFFVTIIIFLLLIVSQFVLAQSNPASPQPVAQVQRIAGLNARFIVALISDGEGGAWIGDLNVRDSLLQKICS
jgi:hypothetical protein